MKAEWEKLPLTVLDGVGKKRSEDLLALGIGTVGDLLHYFPFRYEDFRIRDLTQAVDGERLTLEAEVCGWPAMMSMGARKTRLTCRFRSGPFLFQGVWFNQPFLKDRFKPGQAVIISGKWDGRRKMMLVTDFEIKGEQPPVLAGSLQPVYSVGGPIQVSYLRKLIRQALKVYGEQIDDFLPAELLRKRRLMSRAKAIGLLHDPQDLDQLLEARRRMGYEEFFLFQLRLQAFRAKKRREGEGIVRTFAGRDIRPFVRTLPFELTASQKKVLLEILDDMKRPAVMNRLLQGDVGSGKTAVAAIALYANYISGHQGALMVPTEILAEQHYHALRQMFEPFGIQVERLTGSLSEKQRRATYDGLQMGLIDIVIGTHALVQEKVHFKSLGLVVTDEQHRFGVEQRSIFRRKGLHPDVLAMTATPIPRTMAITMFGDMDVSTIAELPSGRKPIKTYWVKRDMLARVVAFIQKEAAAGRQAYVICPLIEESDKLDVQNAVELYQQLQQELEPDVQVGLLHGRMSGEEKEQAMREFAANAKQVLVSTTVVEVGVDVPNATLMIIYDADRFGLSQLHQLRGRVGRGEHQSYCILVADPKSETAKERLKVMTDTIDGFEISRRDLEIRGPGEVFGTRQSGLPNFRIGDLLQNFEWMEMARDDAAALLGQKDFWTSVSTLPLVAYLAQSDLDDRVLLD